MFIKNEKMGIILVFYPERSRRMKVGVVIVSHHEIGKELLKATESIVKENLSFKSVAIFPSYTLESSQKKILEAVKEVDQGHGVLILSDLFGASPCNACLPVLKRGEVELVTGMNLPMVIKLFSLQQEMSLESLVNFIVDYGQKNIRRATDVL